jgi:ubiquinone/menaquinone biosynthesis C-methylase UbiE
LPFKEASFDAAFLICVLHHVSPADRAGVLKDVFRVLKPGGVLLVFEHNPFNPLTRLAVSRCEFDRDAQLLPRRLAARLLEDAGVAVFEQRYILVFPFKIKGSRWVEHKCRRIPLGAQYYVAGEKPV